MRRVGEKYAPEARAPLHHPVPPFTMRSGGFAEDGVRTKLGRGEEEAHVLLDTVDGFEDQERLPRLST